MDSYKVTLPVFEGPFDLLVYLIESAEMSIYDIRITEITEQYIAYVDRMKEWNPDVSSEFMVLASELLRIKSRMLLPHEESTRQKGPEPPDDPREELVRQILEYQKCRKASQQLARLEASMENVFTKPQEDISVYTESPDEYLKLDASAFIHAFRGFLHRKRRLEETRRRYTTMRREKETMKSRMGLIRDRFLRAGRGNALDFQQLVPSKTRMDAIVSFLAVLQLTRAQYLSVQQFGLYGRIEITEGEKPLEGFSADEFEGNE